MFCWTEGEALSTLKHISLSQMLASILIRVVLADVFGSLCSIITLDEPTTNLDSTKVENIGEMLTKLIEHRSRDSGKSFQLIVSVLSW